MKKIVSLSIVAAFIAVSGAAFAGGNTGIGLGNQLFKGKKGKVFEVLAVTTNMTSGNQTFAITSGTSDYQEGVTIASNDVENYVSKNMESIAVDMSRGNGEYLDTLASILKIEDKASFNAKMQKNFSNIYTSDSVSAKEVAENILSVSNS